MEQKVADDRCQLLPFTFSSESKSRKLIPKKEDKDKI